MVLLKTARTTYLLECSQILRSCKSISKIGNSTLFMRQIRDLEGFLVLGLSICANLWRKKSSSIKAIILKTVISWVETTF